MEKVNLELSDQLTDLEVNDLIDGEVEVCLVEDSVENEFNEEISVFVEVGRLEVKVDSIIFDTDTLNVRDGDAVTVLLVKPIVREDVRVDDIPLDVNSGVSDTLNV